MLELNWFSIERPKYSQVQASAFIKDGMSERKRAIDECGDEEFRVVLRHLKDMEYKGLSESAAIPLTPPGATTVPWDDIPSTPTPWNVPMLNWHRNPSFQNEVLKFSHK